MRCARGSSVRVSGAYVRAGPSAGSDGGGRSLIAIHEGPQADKTDHDAAHIRHTAIYPLRAIG